MKRLILTTSESGAGCLKAAAIADKVIGIGYRFSAGPLLSEAELAESFATFASFGLTDMAIVSMRSICGSIRIRTRN